MHLQTLKLLCPTVYGEMHLQEMFDLTLTQCHIKNCPLHHVTYVPAKFEVDTANGLIMYFLVNKSPPKPLDVATSNFVAE